MRFAGWERVAESLRGESSNPRLTDGQRASLCHIAARLDGPGVIIADDVGMGKTRIAVYVAQAVVAAGGRVALLLPPGLGHQWETELRGVNIGGQCTPVLRSLLSYIYADIAWAEKAVVMVSHHFATLRIRADAQPWRTALFPLVMAQWMKERGEGAGLHWRSFSGGDEKLEMRAKDIAAVAKANQTLARGLKDVCDEHPWDKAKLAQPANYRRDGHYRGAFEKVIGLGFGPFDLIVLDEAHKARDKESALSRLQAMLHTSPGAKRLCLTATPIDLASDNWQSALERIGLSEAAIEQGLAVASEYDAAALELQRAWRTSDASRKRYIAAAQAFQAYFGRYLLRRGKDEDTAVRRFVAHGGRSSLAYRAVRPIRIQPPTLSRDWREVVYAAEGLSCAAHGTEDAAGKRVRQGLGGGQSLGALIDSAQEPPAADAEDGRMDAKRRARAAYWREVARRRLNGSPEAIYEHPVILAAAEAADSYARKEKVLIFGRYIAPMRALCRLLNARQMLRCLTEGSPWPHAKLHEAADDDPASMRRALEVAQRQLGVDINLDDIDGRLDVQYKKLVERRSDARTELLNAALDVHVDDPRSRAILKRLRGEPSTSPVRQGFARLFSDTMGTESDPRVLAKGIEDLAAALTDQDGEDDEDESEERVERAWESFQANLPRSRSQFARLMDGSTSLSTRRLLQFAFNVASCWPRVLVAQSLVGREGLNLHRACRAVISLHLEWNPGALEQQIGRVDRIRSYWEQLLDAAISEDARGDALPQIEVRPIIFAGTYDEHQWTVLKGRWERMRAQLHGDIIADDENLPDGDAAMRSDLIRYAPRFPGAS